MVEEGSREADGGRKINRWGMRVTIIEPRQTSIPSNVEQEAKPVVVLVSRGGEARRQKRRLGGREVGRGLLGVVQRKENEGEMLDIEKREGSGGSKSERLIEMDAVARERIEGTAKELRVAHRKGENSISMG
jgi:hypothetical protein